MERMGEESVVRTIMWREPKGKRRKDRQEEVKGSYCEGFMYCRRNYFTLHKRVYEIYAWKFESIDHAIPILLSYIDRKGFVLAKII